MLPNKALGVEDEDFFIRVQEPEDARGGQPITQSPAQSSPQHYSFNQDYIQERSGSASNSKSQSHSSRSSFSMTGSNNTAFNARPLTSHGDDNKS